jgi:dipeptidyl aminopeptidase/acylaminoacyl peptidase
MQRRLDRAAASPAMARIELMQNEPENGVVTVTPTSVELVLLGPDSELRYVTTVPLASLLLSETWTRDSSRLAFSLTGFSSSERPRPQFDGALISEEVYRDATGNLPPSINPLLQNNNTYLVDIASGVTQILRPSGDTPPLLSVEAWSPDNQSLLVEAWHPARIKGRSHPTYLPQYSERASYRFYDLSLNEVGRLEGNLFSGGTASLPTALFVSPDELIVRAAVGTDRHAYYYNRVSGELRNLADQAGTYGAIVATNNSRQIVFVFQSFTTPPDIYRMGWEGADLTRLTWQNEELRLYAGLRQEPVSFTLRNGQRRGGVLIQSAEAPFPPSNTRLIVWQEGGPGVAMLNRWLANVENPYALLPGAGFALLMTPLAGRPGYTPSTFNALADNANFGSVDIDEQAEIVRQLIARGWTSQGKVGITGCSYGGYFALQSAVRHPELYAAANPQCALVDTLTEWSRGYASLMPHLQGLPPYSIPEEYRRDSPLYNAERIRAAVLTFHGSNDFLPVVQNQNLHLQLVNRDAQARMLVFAGEGHGLANPVNQGYAAQEQIAWFRAYLRE